MLSCLNCGAVFAPRPRKANRFCSLPCYHKHGRGKKRKPRVRQVPCFTCGAEHTPTRSKKRDGTPVDRHFCSRACYLAEHKRRVDWKCAGCGTTERLSPSTAKKKYCSLDCRVRTLRPTPTNCLACGVWFTAIKAHYDKAVVRFSGDSNRKVCSDHCVREWHRKNPERKKKISAAFRGPKHHNWKGGRTYLSNAGYRGPDWPKITERIRKRAGFECEGCGVSESDMTEALHVHHIVPFHNFERVRDANKLSNLKALCRSCHSKEESQTDATQLTLTLGANRHANRSRGRLRGERHHRAKITRLDVLNIRNRAANGESLSSIARDFPLTLTAVSRIVSGQSWAHVPMAA